jgi:hypothetical protein
MYRVCAVGNQGVTADLHAGDEGGGDSNEANNVGVHDSGDILHGVFVHGVHA